LFSPGIVSNIKNRVKKGWRPSGEAQVRQTQPQPKPVPAASTAGLNGRVSGIQLATELRTLKEVAQRLGGKEQVKELLDLIM
jgi:hypothetical protein